jgi:hypothetical protein
MPSRHDPMTTVLTTIAFADQRKLLAVERTMRGVMRWLQAYLRNVPLEYKEEFGDELLTIKISIKVADILALTKAEKPKAHRDNS